MLELFLAILEALLITIVISFIVLPVLLVVCLFAKWLESFGKDKDKG